MGLLHLVNNPLKMTYLKCSDTIFRQKLSEVVLKQ